MEYFEMKKTESGLHIDGFPEAVKVIRLSGPKARRMAGLALHKMDLDFAMYCLEGINKVSAEPALQEALWRSAITHLMKCFGENKARFSLDENKILKGDHMGQEVFDYFKNLRHKHLVHDENSYTQSLPGAILNADGLDCKIAKIVCSCFFSVTLDQAAYGNLHLLVSRTRDWVVSQFDELTNILTRELEAVPHAELLKYESVTYKRPTVEDIGTTRT